MPAVDDERPTVGGSADERREAAAGATVTSCAGVPRRAERSRRCTIEVSSPLGECPGRACRRRRRSAPGAAADGQHRQVARRAPARASASSYSSRSAIDLDRRMPLRVAVLARIDVDAARQQQTARMRRAPPAARRVRRELRGRGAGVLERRQVVRLRPRSDTIESERRRIASSSHVTCAPAPRIPSGPALASAGAARTRRRPRARAARPRALPAESAAGDRTR